MLGYLICEWSIKAELNYTDKFHLALKDRVTIITVSYTHLTLPTKRIV